MAALNEGETVGSCSPRCRRRAGLPCAPVVVDDGSTDDTADVAARAGAIVAVHRHNLGQGDGLRTGFAVAQEIGAAVVVTMDADGQHDPGAIATLVEPILPTRRTTCRDRISSAYDDAGGMRHAGIKGFTTLINMLARRG